MWRDLYGCWWELQLQVCWQVFPPQHWCTAGSGQRGWPLSDDHSRQTHWRALLSRCCQRWYLAEGELELKSGWWVKMHSFPWCHSFRTRIWVGGEKNGNIQFCQGPYLFESVYCSEVKPQRIYSRRRLPREQKLVTLSEIFLRLLSCFCVWADRPLGPSQGHLTHLRGLVLKTPPSISSIKGEPSQRNNGKVSVLRTDMS